MICCFYKPLNIRKISTVVSLLPPGELWRGMLLILQKLGGRFWVCRFDTVDSCEAKSEFFHQQDGRNMLKPYRNHGMFNVYHLSTGDSDFAGPSTVAYSSFSSFSPHFYCSQCCCSHIASSQALWGQTRRLCQRKCQNIHQIECQNLSCFIARVHLHISQC